MRTFRKNVKAAIINTFINNKRAMRKVSLVAMNPFSSTEHLSPVAALWFALIIISSSSCFHQTSSNKAAVQQTVREQLLDIVELNIRAAQFFEY